MPTEEPKKVVPRGKALRRTATEMDTMTSAEAMMDLADEAAEDWRDNAPADAKNLLDADSDE